MQHNLATLKCQKQMPKQTQAPFKYQNLFPAACLLIYNLY